MPERVLFIGGGYIYFEFAHIAARAGTRVTILHRGQRPLERFDPDLVDQLVSRTSDLGVETREALRSLDGEGRAIVARVVWRRLEGAGTQSEALWNDLIGPWLDRVWPTDLDMRDLDASLNSAMAVAYTGAAFRTSVDFIAPLLIPAEHCSLLWQRLLSAGIVTREPQATLKLTGAIVDTVAMARPETSRDPEPDPSGGYAAFGQPVFRKLSEHLLQHNQ